MGPRKTIGRLNYYCNEKNEK